MILENANFASVIVCIVHTLIYLYIHTYNRRVDVFSELTRARDTAFHFPNSRLIISRNSRLACACISIYTLFYIDIYITPLARLLLQGHSCVHIHVTTHTHKPQHEGGETKPCALYIPMLPIWNKAGSVVLDMYWFLKERWFWTKPSLLYTYICYAKRRRRKLFFTRAPPSRSCLAVIIIIRWKLLSVWSVRAKYIWALFENLKTKEI